MEINSTNRKKRSRDTFFTIRKIGIALFIATTTVAILLQVATWLNAQEMFLVKKIKVEGNQFLKNDAIRQMVKIDSTKHLFEFDLNKIAAEISQHQLIESAAVTRSLPATLIIHVTEKEPLAILNSSKLIPIDKSGDSLDEFKSEMILDYPIISSKPVNNGDFKKILTFLQYTKENQFSLYSQISEISYSTQTGLYFYLNKGVIPVIVGHGKVEQKSYKLLEVLKTLTNDELSNIQYFDLRFRDRVVVKTT